MAACIFLGVSLFVFPAKDSRPFEEMWIPKAFYLAHTDQINHRNKAKSGVELLAGIRKNAVSITADRRTLSDIVYVQGKSKDVLDAAATFLAQPEGGGFVFERVYGGESHGNSAIFNVLFAVTPLFFWLVFMWITWPRPSKLVEATTILFAIAAAFSWWNVASRASLVKPEKTVVSIVSDSNDVIAPFPEVFKRNLLKLHMAELMRRRVELEGYLLAFQLPGFNQVNGIATEPGTSTFFVVSDAPPELLMTSSQEAVKYLQKSGPSPKRP